MEQSPKPKKASKKDDQIQKMLDRLTNLEDRLETKEAEAQMLEETIADMRQQYELDGFTEEPEAEILYDPYYSKRPYMIIGEIPPDQTFPEGQVLGWKNEKHREQRRGWRGWRPMGYGDQYTGKDGELLKNYIVDPPPRMEGSTKMDNWVRRTDSVLCRLDKRIFDARQTRRETLSRRNVSGAGSSRTQVLKDGVEVVGAGLRTQDRPAGGFRMGEKRIAGEHHQDLPVHPKVPNPEPQEE